MVRRGHGCGPAATQRKLAMPMVKAKRLAKEMGERERASCACPAFSPTAAVRSSRDDDTTEALLTTETESLRRLVWRRAWRWARARVTRSAHHLELVLTSAHFAAGMEDADGGVRRRMLKARRRLGLGYVADGEHALAREHLAALVAACGPTRASDESARVWRALARCDLELFRLSPAVANADARLSDALAAYRECFDHTAIDVAVVAQIPRLFLELAAVYEAHGARVARNPPCVEFF